MTKYLTGRRKVYFDLWFPWDVTISEQGTWQSALLQSRVVEAPYKLAYQEVERTHRSQKQGWHTGPFLVTSLCWLDPHPHDSITKQHCHPRTKAHICYIKTMATMSLAPVRSCPFPKAKCIQPNFKNPHNLKPYHCTKVQSLETSGKPSAVGSCEIIKEVVLLICRGPE